MREHLERVCGSLVSQSYKSPQKTPSLTRHVLREMSLTLQQLDQLRTNFQGALNSLESFRENARNRYLNVEKRARFTTVPSVEHATSMHRETLLIIDLEAQRRRLVVEHQRETHVLEQRLLTLLHRHEQLTLQNGYE